MFFAIDIFRCTNHKNKGKNKYTGHFTIFFKKKKKNRHKFYEPQNLTILLRSPRKLERLPLLFLE